jgi:hypothetical protein
MLTKFPYVSNKNYGDFLKNILTTGSRQRVGKHIPATKKYPLLCNGDVKTVFSVGSVPRIYKGTEKT